VNTKNAPRKIGPSTSIQNSLVLAEVAGLGFNPLPKWIFYYSPRIVCCFNCGWRIKLEMPIWIKRLRQRAEHTGNQDSQKHANNVLIWQTTQRNTRKQIMPAI
jgi:hypothetical protein